MRYSPLVHAAQIGLKSLGFDPGPLDGFDGPRTQAALMRWKAVPLVGQTFDARTETVLKTLDPKAQTIFRQFITAARLRIATSGYEWVAISGNRTFKEQDALYAKGRTAPGKIVTNAKAGQSNHNFGIAVDFGVFKDGVYVDVSSPRDAERIHRLAASVAAAFGIEWGGNWSRFKDFPHFEVITGLSSLAKRQRVLRGLSVLP
jgi:peptidoglycan L-alanyl-D-glutamate endopeptidase CwlK